MLKTPPPENPEEQKTNPKNIEQSKKFDFGVNIVLFVYGKLNVQVFEYLSESNSPSALLPYKIPKNSNSTLDILEFLNNDNHQPVGHNSVMVSFNRKIHYPDTKNIYINHRITTSTNILYKNGDIKSVEVSFRGGAHNGSSKLTAKKNDNNDYVVNDPDNNPVLLEVVNEDIKFYLQFSKYIFNTDSSFNYTTYNKKQITVPFDVNMEKFMQVINDSHCKIKTYANCLTPPIFDWPTQTKILDIINNTQQKESPEVLNISELQIQDCTVPVDTLGEIPDQNTHDQL